jgi:hypothetical protein
MIIVKLMGGLGNQMFQYAAGKALAVKHNTIMKLDLSFFYDQHSIVTKRNYELNEFNNDLDIATSSEIKEYTKWEDKMVYKNVAKYFPFFKNHFIYRENTFCFNKKFFSLHPNTYLIGYWQSEKYFTSIAEAIRNDFSFRNIQSELSNEISSCNSVSLHVRRGDYVASSETASLHPVCPPKYFYKAADYIADRIDSPVFYIFSDDLEWVKMNLKLKYPMKFCTTNAPNTGYFDLHLMTLCKHSVIANSSFSWWGAWLSSANNKLVIAPKYWFRDSSIDTKDLIPVNWLKL